MNILIFSNINLQFCCGEAASSLPRLFRSFLKFPKLGAHALIPRLQFTGRTIHLAGLLRPQPVFGRSVFGASKSFWNTVQGSAEGNQL